MIPHHDAFGLLPQALVLLAAMVIGVPIARRIGLSAIIAYLAAGILIGPWGIGIFSAPETILTVAELGVVMLLFVIGLELEPSRLFAMRRDIFGLGAAQLALTAMLIGALALYAGLIEWRGAVVIGLALALSSTAIALQILDERGHFQRTYGQRAFAILLFQDIAVVPLIAMLPLLAPGTHAGSLAEALRGAAAVVGAILAVVVAGRFLLNPFFRLLASTGSREVMTAAALLVVLGAALLMQAAGMSMALGAFLAGVLLAESNFRHELEADVEPFRGILLALFFMSVGMSIDMEVVSAHISLILASAVGIAALKAAIVWFLFRATCPGSAEALRAGILLTGASEFAFVLLPLGRSFGLLTAEQGQIASAIVAATMLMSSPITMFTELVLRRVAPAPAPEAEEFDGPRGTVLLIGFGRFGQIVAQCLLAEGIDVTAIDNSPAMIQNAARFGFKVYYGDGTRLDVLRAAGAADARLVAVCVNDREATDRIVELVRAEFDGVKLFVRSYDRPHTLALIARGVDYELRETFESAMVFGRRTLEALGLDPLRAQEVEEDVRMRDRTRLVLQQAEGLMAGMDILHRRTMPHEPLRRPERPVRPLNPEAEKIVREDAEPRG
jgi:monovalent cation:proton antiporter-2 (CPA2) family protein